MAIIQSSPIEIAAKSERNWLFILAAWIAISALITGVLTVLLYKKTGKYQEAVQKDADVRISESNAEAKRAGENAGKANERAGLANDSAAKANERAQKLEGDNIQLRTDLETATADSRATQAELAREQTKLAEAQRETAIAQRALTEKTEEIRKRTAPRTLSAAQRERVLRTLKASPKGIVYFMVEQTDPEATNFAVELRALVKEAGWAVYEDPSFRASFLGSPKGLILTVSESDNIPAHVLQEALSTEGFLTRITLDARNHTLPEGIIGFGVGGRP